jgi:hypothetical protein
MTLFKRLLFALLSGALVGAAASTALSAKFITWYNEPGAGQAALCPCATLSKSAVSQLIHWQLVGTAVGALVFVVLTAVFFRPKRATLPPSTPAVPQA